MIKTYQLFNEWRARTLYGETLTDALNRIKKLQRPDKYADGRRVKEGEWIGVAAVKQNREHNTTRGGNEYESVIIETTDGQYMDVDAYEVGNTRGNRIV